MDIGYTEAMAEREYVEDDRADKREPFILRVPVPLLAKMKAAAEAETKLRGREQTVTSMVLKALKDHYAQYEKDYGALPPARPKTPKKGASKDALREHTAAVKRQEEAMAKYVTERRAAEKH